MNRSILWTACWLVLASISATGCGGGNGPSGPPVVVDLLVVPGSEGTVHSDGTVTPGGAFLIGDSATNVAHRALLRFSTAAIPAGAVLESAVLRVHQSSVVGSPYATLGEVVLQHVSLDRGAGPGLDAGDFASPPVSDGFAMLSRETTIGYHSIDLVVGVSNDLRAGRTTSDLRIHHVAGTDGDSTADRSSWNNGTDALGNGNVPHLVVTYRLP
jgi:hypothetical protein